MGREKPFGLSSREFLSRVRKAGNVAQVWPFEDLFTEESFADHYNSKNVTWHAADHSSNIAIGTIFSEGDQISMILSSQNDYIFDVNTHRRIHQNKFYDFPRLNPIRNSYLHFEMTPPETKAWKLMDGIAVAVEVQLGYTKNRRTNTRTAAITHIHGIEQPLLTPDDQGAYPFDAAGRNVGFIQGTVLEDTGPHVNFTALLDPGFASPPATIKGYYNDEHFQSPHIWPINKGLTQGETLRARVRRNTESPHLFLVYELPIYFLNRGPSRNRIRR